jgi:hypothetical protein
MARFLCFNLAIFLNFNIKIIMKKYIIILVAIAFSCTKKEPCEYDKVPDGIVTPPVSGCIESEFAGYMVATVGKSNASTALYNEVAYVFKTTFNAIAPFGDDWNKSTLGVNQVQTIHPSMWIVAKIGNVFGIALDDNKGVFLSATDVFGWDGSGSAGYSQIYGPAGASGIYYTDLDNPNTTINLVSTLSINNANTVGTNKIPNSNLAGPIGRGNSIGNIAYDKVNSQLFATNLEDGRIYRINPTTGIVKSIFDPFMLDVPADGRAPLGEQLWGIGVFTNSGITSVYFARSTVAGGKQIWSIPLNSAGEFAATEVGSTKLFNDTALSSKQENILVLGGGVPGQQNKVTDIAFSKTGRMLVAERGYDGHRSQIFEFVKSGLLWIAGNKFYVGDVVNDGFHPDGQNATGGVDYGNREIANKNFKCDDIVWATGNLMKPINNPPYIYGIQGMSSSGNSATLSINSTNDLYLDPINTLNEKGGLGDVEIFKSKCPCNN